ncbi:hypothetical protein [Homoserinibacter sp. YIM 151385]|uniref:hypothetical protein n=1 Tax=Homoserinibacter sp. YIM 151385 TaxID=2985506 RepID=UPI0022F13031|nr:hypothetical protein [Homoserinibacter sp. YIM 151385]WBU37350.1 hypothetical protein OF852_10545 [Homoserinibacter sp. YIM 151385]
MRVRLRGAGIGRGPAAALPPVDALLRPGAPVAIAVEGPERAQLLSLLLGGRIPADVGEVLVDEPAGTAGRGAAAALRRRVAVVDAPAASEPGPGIPLGVVVAEELAFAGRPAGRRHVRALLAEHGLESWRRARTAAVPAAARIRLLTALAARRPGVEALVLCSPERHGGDPADWLPHLLDLARDGLAIAIATDAPTAAALRGLGAEGALEPAGTPPPLFEL